MELHTILGDIRKADQDYHLIDDGDRIAVGVSGGKDSMVLLTALHMYSKFADRNFEVVGIHLKLGFPNMDFSEVVAFCRQQGITFYQYDSQVYEILKRNPDKEGNIKCSLCSKFKKATVIDAAKKLNCTKVAFGHHSDDAVETLLMNAIHGGKLATFLPKMYMSRTDTTFIRPLVYSYESDILSALERNQIPFVKSTCPNDGYTERQAMKDMLQEFYRSYPMAQKNFIRMLYNEDQVELWHREGDHRAEKAKSMSVLLKEEGDLQLTR
ncbi:MAG TPA: tRNA 2-thiocytidine(32) synthetase TtcA, partial [Erysipelotrichaceae bacterium]|nr:tRNA 2-thiocytidine(32) synthetase TtcA [Erysipelotrichaceae bacterium]